MPIERLSRLFTSKFSLPEDQIRNIRQILKAFVDTLPSHSISQPVILHDVRSYIFKGKGSIPYTSFVVPKWCRHWVIHIDNQMYHLVYDMTQKRVQFQNLMWIYDPERAREHGHAVQNVGTTSLSVDSLIKIGKSMQE